MRLRKTFSPEQYARALDSWAWIGVAGKRPLFTSLFGDVFLEGDGLWYLDTKVGSLTRAWDTTAAIEAGLATSDGEDNYLLAVFVASAEARGMVLGPDEVYDFVPPPVLGGGFDVENINVMSFVVAVNIAGQLHEQVKDLPPGAKIDRITIDDSPPPTGPVRRKRWFGR